MSTILGSYRTEETVGENSVHIKEQYVELQDGTNIGNADINQPGTNPEVFIYALFVVLHQFAVVYFWAGHLIFCMGRGWWSFFLNCVPRNTENYSGTER